MTADPEVVALLALAHIVSEQALCDRFLSLSGLAPEDLRAAVGDISVQLAALDFLAGHEPDLLACAAAIGLEPDALKEAREGLSRR